MRVLVTGGAGFIGSHLIRRLLGDGHDVRVIDNFSTGRRENLVDLDDDIEVVEGDIQSYERVAATVAGCDAVLHQAASPSVQRSIQDPLTSNATNVTGTLNVFLAARDASVGRVVFASSAAVYGANPALPKTEGLVPAPISPYAVSKLANEHYARSFHEVYGLEAVALRYFNVFGPRQNPRSQYASAIPRFITALLDDRRPGVFGDGEQTRDFVYVENVVEANMLALKAVDAPGCAFNVALGRSTSVNELLALLRGITGSEAQAEYLPPRPGEVMRSLADIAEARRVLGFEPVVGLEQGLEATVEWFAAESSRAVSA